MAGENALFGANGFNGTPQIPSSLAWFKVVKLNYGVEMDYVEKESRTQRTVYFTAQLDDNFILTLLFSNWTDYSNAAAWFQAYGTFATSLTSSTITPMSVFMPAASNFPGFSGIGIPTTGVSLGDSFGEITYTMTLSFEGAYDQLNQASSYQEADYHGQAQYFYPSGAQTGSATAVAEETIYNQNVAPLTPTNTPVKVSSGGKPEPSTNSFFGIP